MTRSYLYILAFVLLSCSETETQNQAVQSVINLCECEVEEFKGAKVDKNGVEGHLIELTLSNNENLKAAQPIASISALVYFNNLSKDEQNKVNQIDITIDYTKFEKEAITTFSFSPNHLTIAKEKLDLIKKHISLIQKKDYQGFLESYEGKYNQYSIDQINNYFKQQDSAYGEITDFKMIGFGFFKSNMPDSANVINIMGKVKRNAGFQKINFTYYDQLDNNKIREFSFE